MIPSFTPHDVTCSQGRTQPLRGDDGQDFEDFLQQGGKQKTDWAVPHEQRQPERCLFSDRFYDPSLRLKWRFIGVLVISSISAALSALFVKDVLPIILDSLHVPLIGASYGCYCFSSLLC